MSDFLLAAGFLAALVSCRALFAAVEVALSAGKRNFLEAKRKRGHLAAAAALELMDEPDAPLVALRLLTALVEIAALVGLGLVLARWWDALHPGLWAALALALAALVLTLGHMVPSRLAARWPSGVLLAVARPLRLWSRVAGPPGRALETLSRVILRGFRIETGEIPPVTPEEIDSLLELGAKAGVFEKAEREMFDRVMRLGDRRVQDIMTPRVSIVFLDVDDSVETVNRKIREAPHSRFPVCEGSLDHVVGVVHIKDLLAQSLRGERLDLRGLIQVPNLVPHTLRAFQLLEEFKKREGMHMAIVLGEFGEVLGLVSLTDVLEAIIGELPHSNEDDERMVVQRDDGSYLLDGMLPIDEVLALLALPPLPEDERGDYRTLAGFVITRLGHVPNIAESFVWEGRRFEVVDTDGRRVDRVHVSNNAESPGGDAA